MVSHLRRAVVLALATVFLTAGVAFAGNGATVTHFAASYHDLGDPTLPMIDCTGNRIVKPGPNGWVKDTETCVTTYADYWPVGVLYRIVPFTGTSLEDGNWTDDIWFSDYEGFTVVPPFTNPVCVQPLSDDSGICLRPAISGVMSVSYSAGTGLYTISAVAYYAP
jgi:hypothetical protein